MGQFFKFLFASLLGVLIGFFVLFIILSGVVASAVSDARQDAPTLKDNSVLELTFNQPIPEQPTDNPFERLQYLGNEFEGQPALKTYLDYIDKAATDDRIEGIYLRLGNVPAGMSQLMELRQALQDFRDGGKFIYAYGNNFSQKAYLMASVADSVFLNPEGRLLWRGLSSVSYFLRGALDRLEIKPQVFKVGKYKGAVEPFTRKDFSESNRKQITLLLQSVYGHYLDQIGPARNIDTVSLHNYADSLKVRTPEDALQLRLVDHLAHEDEVLDAMRTRLALGQDDPIEQVDFLEFKAANKPSLPLAKEQDKGALAVIFAEGNIVTGKSQDGTIGSESLARTIRKARKDTTVKAIVLRVNSPGGSALASDIIAREIALAKAEKPVIASMGNLAASGGYYISCLADAIVAQPTSITGSIGVFAVFPNIREFMNDKLGITFDRVKTGPYADFPSTTRELTEDEKMIFQQFIDDTYESFLERVAQGRNMSTEQVHALAQGRVYTGAQAMEVKLVDELGGLEAAVQMAADEAELEDFKVRELPKTENPFEQLLKFVQKQAMTRMLDPLTLSLIEESDQMRTMTEIEGAAAIMPYRLEFE